MRSWKTCIGLLLLHSFVSLADDIEKAPPSFPYRQSKAVPVDFKSVELRLDVRTSKSEGYAIIEFDSHEAGFPFFDLVPSMLRARLNGREIAGKGATLVDAPDRVTKFMVLDEVVAADASHVLEIWFDAKYLDLNKGLCRVNFMMSDLASSGREFWEQYAPANFEFDQFKQTLWLTIHDTTTPHEVFTNGSVASAGTNAWKIDFPEYFTTSSFYLHITDKDRFQVRRANFQGMQNLVPIISYSETSSLADSGLSRTLQVMKELENTYGPYPHESFVAYVTNYRGGMEHVGSTITSLSALAHEITHSWFARGVMPSSGNSGWIDEAIASWRDNSYPQAKSAPSRSPVNLGGFSPYRRHTTSAAYTDGMKLISEMDFMFRDIARGSQRGMRAILADFFLENQKKTITVAAFQSYLENFTGRDLTAIFRRYVYGSSSMRFSDMAKSLVPEHLESADFKTQHPRPFTHEERLLLH
jgi:hypothetical protein